MFINKFIAAIVFAFFAIIIAIDIYQHGFEPIQLAVAVAMIVIPYGILRSAKIRESRS